MARQQGITGTVAVDVRLDARSAVIDARVASTPSVLLSAAATSAARNSQYETEVVNCVAVASVYRIMISFPSEAGQMASGTGDVTLPASSATISFNLRTAGADEATAGKRNREAYRSLQDAVAGIGGNAADWSMPRYVMQLERHWAPAPAENNEVREWAVYRAVQIHFHDVSAAIAVYRVIRAAAGIEGSGIELAPQDETAAYDAAFAAALRDAQAQAEAEAKRAQRHIGRPLLVRANRIPEPALSQSDALPTQAHIRVHVDAVFAVSDTGGK